MKRLHRTAIVATRIVHLVGSFCMFMLGACGLAPTADHTTQYVSCTAGVTTDAGLLAEAGPVYNPNVHVDRVDCVIKAHSHEELVGSMFQVPDAEDPGHSYGYAQIDIWSTLESPIDLLPFSARLLFFVDNGGATLYATTTDGVHAITLP